MKIFDIPEFKPFHWVEEYEQLCGQISPTKNYQDLVLNQYAIVPVSWILKKDNVDILNVDYFGEKKLIGIFTKKIFNHNLVKFKSTLFYMHADYAQYFLNIIIKHLEKRLIKETPVIKLDHIKQLIAEIISDLEVAKMITPLNVAHDSLLAAALKLMKLPGGRAFLKGSVLELVWVLRAFNDVYYVS